MTTMAANNPLTPAELKRLSAALASDRLPDAMPLDAVQGAFFAMTSGPAEFPTVERWLPWMIGDDAQWQDDTQRADIEALLQRFAGESRRDILESDEALPLFLYDDDAGKPDYQTWCRGYLEGVDFSDPAWDTFADEAAVIELLLPLEVLALDHTAHADPIEGIDDVAAYLREARDDLPGILLDIRQYWFDRRTSRVPLTRESPKVGRNDPCPCGSGRKFKQCHGAS